MEQADIVNGVARQAMAGAAGITMGAVTRQAVAPLAGSRGTTAVKIGSTVGAALANGASPAGAIAAGGAVVTAKVIAATTLMTAAAPFALGALAIGGLCLGLRKILDEC